MCIRDSFEGRREAEFSLGGRTLRTCTVSGLKNARDLIEDLRAGTVHYDFVEVMACPGGCVGGGGQPILDGVEMADVRGPRLYKLDEQRPVSYTHLENEHFSRRDYLVKPFCFLAALLHWFNPLVWFYFKLMTEDMERSCDDRVLRKICLLYTSRQKSRFGGGIMFKGAGEVKDDFHLLILKHFFHRGIGFGDSIFFLGLRCFFRNKVINADYLHFLKQPGQIDVYKRQGTASHCQAAAQIPGRADRLADGTALFLDGNRSPGNTGRACLPGRGRGK